MKKLLLLIMPLLLMMGCAGLDVDVPEGPKFSDFTQEEFSKLSPREQRLAWRNFEEEHKKRFKSAEDILDTSH